jgi:hypothetical protein
MRFVLFVTTAVLLWSLFPLARFQVTGFAGSSSPHLADRLCTLNQLCSFIFIFLKILAKYVLLFGLMQWVLSSNKEINFPYPVALALLHMAFSSIACFAITKVFKVHVLCIKRDTNAISFLYHQLALQ